MKIKKGSANIYADLGTANAEGMYIRAQLAVRISEIIKTRKLTQQQASKLMEISQAKLSNMLRGNFRGISETKMMSCLTLMGSDISIVVKNRARARTAGHLSVVFAS